MKECHYSNFLDILNNTELIKIYHFYTNTYYGKNSDLIKNDKYIHFKTILGKSPKEKSNNCISECKSVQWNIHKLQDTENFVHILLNDDHFEIIETVDQIICPNIVFIVKNCMIK